MFVDANLVIFAILFQFFKRFYYVGYFYKIITLMGTYQAIYLENIKDRTTVTMFYCREYRIVN